MDPSGSPQDAGGANAAPQKLPTCDVKPRLTKEQHDVLEQHFQAQHKPSTMVKKDFAAKLGVPLDKINNWFQNRRAKVKQDRKKVANQMSMAMNTPYGGMYGTMPPRNAPYPQHPDQQLLHMAMSQDYHPLAADISPAMLPVQSTEGTSALDLTPQILLQQSYDMQALRSIPEGTRSATYPPNAVMSSLMAAANGSYMHNPSMPGNTQNVEYPYDTTGFASDLSFSMPADMPNEPAPSHSVYGAYGNLGGWTNATEMNTNNSMPADAHRSTASLSTHSSPFSGTQTNPTPQSSNGPTPPSVASVVSAYTGWTEDPNSGTLNQQAEETEDQFTAPYNLNATSASEQTLPFWAQPSTNASYGHGFYQQSNVSSQVILGSPEQDISQKASTGVLDFEPPPMFQDDVYTRRNSSTSNLAGNFEAIQIRNGTPDEFKQPGQPTSIAQRRKGRPVTLNPGAMRSASYSAPMPSPGGSGDHALRRIRSSGIANAAGRVQKSQPGSAQRSPMVANFSEAAASPKFARAFSSTSTATLGQGAGSLAPPTPLTPQDMGIYWQNNTVIRPHSVMPEHNSPESMNANWSTESQSAGAFAKSVSPPSTSLDLQQMTQQYGNEAIYRDSLPQSAPPTQQNFSQPKYMQQPHIRSGFHSSTDLTIAQPKPSHSRRPSLPDTAQAPVDESSFFSSGNINYDDYKDISLINIAHNVPFAPRPSQAPEFLVHEFIPPHGNEMHGNMYRHQSEAQAKNYIFANQGPRDFKS
ncbi:hypothetical protein BDU57DRAFT_267033 [Ampelomyces quisqualis]|uniref:Homeobox domain-containing protein n=1 Tax=Ampelomyces quisqualis TaxID=50730 RepID=A0A6A5QHL1_AMPQU|nr:hypothetical protein BDU57DRAFT_267033 [Ampelomyces quisqualis]